MNLNYSKMLRKSCETIKSSRKRAEIKIFDKISENKKASRN